ncbi:hypothetical protein AEA09_11645 [Lysinibacillus contaminans]|uniref:THIF-type NAD/FAD binding fold domain-containing protein n=1 Tax=Lysinibacillus contaminans TaxID=1293441 RepID=A0ABR5K2L5_9BACI|nr:ThiF family adenylyltransferase [Lysinibacillus contaminans]KOS69133.1 hypothetical protein AEA09_11645 [Lysinibacillus contaminans]
MIRKKLRYDAVIVHYSDYDLILYNNKSVKIRFQTEEFKHIYFLLEKGTSLIELASILPVEYVQVLWESLLQMGVLIDDWDNLDINSYEKQLFHLENLAPTPIHLQQTLREKCVAIIGVGGIGSVILDQLIRLGVQNYILIDSDEVQIHQLNKQYMYSLKDLGFNKVDICFSKIKESHPHGQVLILKKRIKNHEDLSTILQKSNPDIVINAADEPHYLYQEVLKVCIEYQIPFITGSIGPHFGRVGPFIDQPSDMIHFLEDTEYEQRPENIKVINPFFGTPEPSNCIIPILVAYDAVRFLLNKQPSSYNKILHVDFNDLSCKTTPIINK